MKKLRLIHNEIEEHVVVVTGEPELALDVFEEESVKLTFHWRNRTPYTISLPLVSKALKEKLYPKE